MHEIDRQAVPAGEACRARRRRRRAPALRRGQPRQDAGQFARAPRPKKTTPGPRQERAPVERVGQRLAEPEPQRARADRTASSGEATAPRSRSAPTARLAHAGAATNGAAMRLATAMQCRMPKKMPSPGAKTRLASGHQRRGAGDDREPAARTRGG